MVTQIAPGLRFEVDEQITPTKLNNLVDLCVVSKIPAADVVVSPNKELTYGGTTPPIERGRIHYDTTPGFEGLKFAFVSASNASVSKWLYRTPHFDGIFWTVTPVTLGCPCVLAGYRRPTVWNQYDGHFFPLVRAITAQSDENSLQILIPLESAGNDQPVVCAIRGLIPGFFESASGSLLNYVFTQPAASNVSFTVLGSFPVSPAASSTSMLIGIGAAASAASYPGFFFGGPMFQDATP